VIQVEIVIKPLSSALSTFLLLLLQFTRGCFLLGSVTIRSIRLQTPCDVMILLTRSTLQPAALTGSTDMQINRNNNNGFFV